MAIAIYWPTTIGNPSYPLSDSTQDNRIITSMDDGTIKIRARTTRALKKFELTWPGMPHAEKLILEEFYTTTTKGGSKFFIWTNPSDGKNHTVYFTEPPQFSMAYINYWQVSVKLSEV